MQRSMIEKKLKMQAKSYVNKKLKLYEEDTKKMAERYKNNQENIKLEEQNAKELQIKNLNEKIQFQKDNQIKSYAISKTKREHDRQVMGEWQQKDFPHLRQQPLFKSLENKQRVTDLEREAEILAMFRQNKKPMNYEKLHLHQKNIGEMIEKRKAMNASKSKIGPCTLL